MTARSFAIAGRAPIRRWATLIESYGQELVLLAVILLLFLVVGLVNVRFLGASNLISLFAGNAYIAVAAIGMSLVIISGHIDVSVGSLIGVLATISGTLAVHGYPIIVAWLTPLVLGMAINAFVGVLIAYLRIPSIVTTLGMLSILKGGLISVTAGAWITNLPPGYLIAQFRLFGIPSPVYFMAVLTLLAALWARHSSFGRNIYAIGGNPEAARVSGIRIKPSVVTVFAIHGLFAGIAAVLFATQLQVIQSTVPANLELTVITASVVGGVSILGGTGTVIGSTLAAILFATIGSSLIFLNVSAYWLRAVQGLLILATVLADMARRHRIRG
jgi:ribose/xylose/arabinose/galactoside ABC-type transport system permease subunit